MAPKPSPEHGLGWQELPVAQLAMAAMENGLGVQREVVVMEDGEDIGDIQHCSQAIRLRCIHMTKQLML